MVYKTVPSDKLMQKFVHLLLHLITLGRLGILGVYAAFKFHSSVTLPNINCQPALLAGHAHRLLVRIAGDRSINHEFVVLYITNES